jgi:hypothetical protein
VEFYCSSAGLSESEVGGPGSKAVNLGMDALVTGMSYWLSGLQAKL